MITANQKLGYGLLSELGKEAHTELGKRLVARLPQLFSNSKSPLCIHVETSGKARANESAYYFMQGLKQSVNYIEDDANCYLSQKTPSAIDKALQNKFTLYFHKTEPVGDYLQYHPAYLAYQAYLDGEDAPPATELKQALAELKQLEKTKVIARALLERIYTKEFVDYLADGVEFVAIKPDSNKKTYLRNEVDAALMLYNVFIIAPGMLNNVI